MKLLVIDDQLKEDVHHAFKNQGYTMVYILEPRLVDAYISAFEPDIVLIRSDSNTYKNLKLIMDIKYSFPQLPIVLYSSENDKFLTELKARVKNLIKRLSPKVLPLQTNKLHYHGKSLAR